MDSKTMSFFKSFPPELHLQFYDYLNDSDSSCLALTQILESIEEETNLSYFGRLYGSNRNVCKISSRQCWCVPENVFEMFFKQWVKPEKIKLLDISNLYWISRNIVLTTVTSMINLSSLYLDSTKLTIADLPSIFQACPSIIHLGVNLSENCFQLKKASDDASVLKLKALCNGFSKLITLKLISFGSDNYILQWSVVLEILRYCILCENLTVEILYSSRFMLSYEQSNQLMFQLGLVEAFNNFRWDNLKTLVILKKGDYTKRDYFVEKFVDLIFEDNDMSCSRVWIEECEKNISILWNKTINSGMAKSLLIGINCRLNTEFWHQCFSSISHIEHLGGIRIPHLALSNLTYMRCVAYGNEDVEYLCRYQKLENLHLKIIESETKKKHQMDKFMLNNLKTLSYTCNFPNLENFTAFLSASPNMESLNIGFIPNLAINSNIVSALSQLSRLSTLTIATTDLLDGDFLKIFFRNCKLRKLHIRVGNQSAKFFDNLCSSLPFIKELRDFRLQYIRSTEPTSQILIDILNSLLNCKKLERIMIYEEEGRGRISQEFFQNFLTTKVSTLVAFCVISKELSTQYFDPSSLRPAFWGHVGGTLPEGDDLSIPRIHFEEIVCPIDPYYEAPEF